MMLSIYFMDINYVLQHLWSVCTNINLDQYIENTEK